jgi:hypothetical protein
MIRGTPLIAQRKQGDCAIAALAMFAMQTYEDAYVAFSKVDPRRGGSSVYHADILKAAKHLGIGLLPTRRYDLDDDEGVLRVRWNGRKERKQNRHGHFVTVRNGQIFCPADVMVYPWREYLTLYDGRPCTLLRGEA